VLLNKTYRRSTEVFAHEVSVAMTVTDRTRDQKVSS